MSVLHYPEYLPTKIKDLFRSPHSDTVCLHYVSTNQKFGQKSPLQNDWKNSLEILALFIMTIMHASYSNMYCNHNINII